jgi:hypothetical protein
MILKGCINGPFSVFSNEAPPSRVTTNNEDRGQGPFKTTHLPWSHRDLPGITFSASVQKCLKDCSPFGADG